jgi:transposase
MYIQQNISKTKSGKTYKSSLLCHKYREDGKIKTKVLANLSMLSDESLLSLNNSLGKKKGATISLDQLSAKKAIDFGYAVTLLIIMERLRINDLFDKILPQQSSVIKLLIIGKIITRGSKLAIFNWIHRNPQIAKMLGIDLTKIKLAEIYQKLGTIPQYQEQINKKWALYNKTSQNEIFLYDITSSYFEGNQNVLSFFGYNRDGKKGKKQINIGLITDSQGFPLKIQVFEGNVNDHKTVIEQLQTIKSDFKAENIVFVGDRGMKIKLNLDKMQEAEKAGIDYITGLTKDEIKALLEKKVIQMDMFSEQLAEVTDGDHRYILSVNPELTQNSKRFRNRMREKFEEVIYMIQDSYNKKKTQFHNNITKLTNGHKNKNLVTQFTIKQIDSYKRRAHEILKKYFMSSFYTLTIDNEKFEALFNLEQYNNERKLDGCYVVISNVSKEKMDKETLRSHYKDLQHVEHAFRDMKTCGLDVRPIFHVNEATTRGHILISMFSFAIIHQMESKMFSFLKEWNIQNKQQLAYKDIVEELKDVKLVELRIGKNCPKILITELTLIQQKIFDVLEIKQSDLIKKICSN